MVFREDETEAFKEIFHESAPFIRKREGCKHLELWNDLDSPNVFFTFSLWSERENLESYRQSELFKNTWKKTKALFDDKPEAWSIDQVEVHL